MNILTLHNYYMQPGGEDRVFENEVGLLRRHGHSVTPFTVTNKDIDASNNVRLALNTLWNNGLARRFLEVIDRVQPDVVHFHNTFPLISPSAMNAAKRKGLPIVLTLHNYRPYCLNGVLFRDGKVCEDCVGKFSIAGIRHRCYQGSLSKSMLISLYRLLHYDWFKTVDGLVDVFITSSEFARKIFISLGMDGDKILVKPNPVFVDAKGQDNTDDMVEASSNIRGLFVGRLDERKGLRTLIRALEIVDVPFSIVGDGDLRTELEEHIDRKALRNIQMHGWLNNEDVVDQLQEASFLVLPSEFYESFGNVIVEAFSMGLAVVVSDIGAQAGLVNDGVNGIHFKVGNPEDLAAKISWLVEHPNELAKMKNAARKEFEYTYAADRNYEMLMSVYQRAIVENRGR